MSRVLAVLALAVACGAEPPPAPAAPPPAPDAAPKVDTMLGQVTGVTYLGDWTSAGCEGRTYARNLTFFENGEYAAVDLVAPCPPDTSCAWSGLVAYAGLWRQDGTKLLLREIGAPIAAGSPHPTEVQANFEGQLVENGCTYSRGLTVAPGYTEDRVRPRLPGSR